MPVNPPGRCPANFDRFNAEVLRVKTPDWRSSVLPRAPVAERTYNIDVLAHQSRRMEIGRRKNRLRIAKDVNPTVRLMNEYVVIDAKIRIVAIFMLTCNLHDA